MVMDRDMVRTTPPATATTNGSQQNGSVESTPAVNPHTVGREFVRQYYTLLHEAPNYLYRFYSNNSSFIHGGLNGDDVAITGQANIHQRITELNFRDCRAKILHVDAQSSVADGVVIQVTGELSNNGEAMRRFMQTFVLVPLSTKNYYVHNDIFRYTDEVYNDAVTNGASRPAAGANGVDQAVQVQAEPAAPAVPFAVPPVVVPVLLHSDPVATAAAAVPLPAAVTVPPTHVPPPQPSVPPTQPQVAEAAPAPTPVAAPASAPAPAPAPAATPAPAPAHAPTPAPAVQPAPPAATQPPKPAEPTPAPAASPGATPADGPAPVDSPHKHAAPHAKHAPTNRRGAQQPAATQPQPTEQPKQPKTWASLVHTGGSNGKPAEPTPDATKARPAPQPAPQLTTQPQPPVQPPAQPAQGTTNPATAPAPAPAGDKSQTESSWELDSRQVFVGVIPSVVTEQVLRERIAENYSVKVVGWRWLREPERGFGCGLLLLDSDEAATKLINHPRPHVLYDEVHVNFEVKREFRPRPGPGPRRFPPSYTAAPRVTGQNAYAERDRERDFERDRERERGAPRPGPRATGGKRA